MSQPSSQIFIISAPSGSGKSTLVRYVMEHDASLVFSISYTTRAPRGEEQNGREYNFVTREEFLAMRDGGEFLEWAEVLGKDMFYGTHRRYLDEARSKGQDVVLDIDVQGARQLRERFPEAVSILILPPSREELVKRLRDRGDVTEEVIQKRTAQAAGEIREFARYDYVLVNDDKDEACELLLGIIRATRIRKLNPEVPPRVLGILATFE